MSLTVLPIPIKRALAWCKSTHRRLPNLQGAMWAIAALRDSAIVGIAIVGRPTARLLDSTDLPQPALSVLRVACDPADEDPEHTDANGRPHKGANSILYGACARAARAMGCVDLSTYLHHDEPGTSVKAAGWIEDTEHESGGGSYDRPSRSRKPPIEGGVKVRWWAPWSASAPKKATRAPSPQLTAEVAL